MLTYLRSRKDTNMEILVILNQKGGLAKTTTAVNLGSTLAEKKQKVL